jgi:hypothetical protein
MPGLLTQIEQAVGGLDLGQLAAGASGQYGGLGELVGQWQAGAPGDFGAALGNLSGASLPNLSIAGSLGGDLTALLPALQSGLGGLVGNLQAEVTALPQRLEADLLGAIQPLLDRITTFQTLLTSDWSCGLLPAAAVGGAGGGEAGGEAGGEEAGGAGGGGGAATPPQGALAPAQVDAAKALVDTLPADLSVPSLLRWLHQRVGTFRPGYFTLRAIPVLDDLRDPLDTLIRWEDATAGAVEAELQQTLATLAGLIHAHADGRYALALPPAALAQLPAAPLGAAAEAFVAAVEALAAAVQAGDTANLAPRLAAAQGARAALLAQNAAVAAASPAREALIVGLGALPAELDAGLCRLLVLLQPRASFADLSAGFGPVAAPSLPAAAFAPLEALIGDLRDRLTGLLSALDIGAVTGPLTEALASAGQAVQAVEQGLAQLAAQAGQALSQANGAVGAMDLERLREQAEEALEQVTAQLTAAIGQALGPASAALGEALAAASAAMDAIDPEALTEPIREAIQALGEVLQNEAVGRLVEVMAQLQALAGTIEGLSFEPVGDEVIAAIGKIKELLASIDPADLPDPGAALIGEAMSVLPPSLVPLTDPLIAELDVQISGSPIDLLEGIKGLPDQARQRLLAFSPRAALGPLLAEPYQQAVGQLEAFSPQQWLSAADGALADLRARLAAQLDLAALLAGASAAHAELLAEVERFRPSTLLQPLEETLESALQSLGQALPVGDLADGLTGALDRVRSFTRSLDSAMKVAEHLAAKLGVLGQADNQFDAWLESVLAKVPETAAGALATALNGVREAALAARPASLQTTWAGARAPLATALQSAGATARLTRLTLARGRIQSGLAGLPPGAAASRDAIAAWLGEAGTTAAGDGLNALAALDRALAAADTALAGQFQSLAQRFPQPDGPLAPLLPGGPATLRAWVREAYRRQFGQPMVGLLRGLSVLGGMLDTAVAALGDLVQAVEAKLDELLAAPQALADLLGDVAGVQERLAGLDLGIYTQQVDAIYQSLLDQLRALDPRSLRAPLEAARDRVLGQISLDGLLPPALRGELKAAHRELLAKLGALDPDALLLEPLDAEYRETVEPLVSALDISATIDIIIRWLEGLPEDLQAQVARVDVAYGELLASAPGGSGGGASASVGI